MEKANSRKDAVSFKEKFIQWIPSLIIAITGTASLYFSFRSIVNYAALLTGQFLSDIPQIAFFGDSLHPGWIGFTSSLIILIGGWLISTKFKKFTSPFWRQIWFWNMFIGILTYYLWILSASVYNSLVPYLRERISELQPDNIWFGVAVGDTQTLLTTMVFVPTVVIFMIVLWLGGQYSQYAAEIKEAFYEFEIKNSLLQKIFKLDQKEHWPDIVLGPDSETKELIVQPGRDRTLNNIIIGSIGTGKTAALVLPILNQDLHWMTKYINDFPKIYQRDDFNTENINGMYLNGISVIEPSNDLCQKAFQLVKSHGIPEESVFYIDPTNPNTPSINPMQGPVDKVAEAFSMVIEGLAEGGNSNFFFQQSERNHLKHYIYLLKLHNPDQEVTFDMLLQMYDNPQMVHIMHEKLKETIPKNYMDIEDRDERNHWAIVKQIDEWFNMNHLPKTSKAGGVTSPELVQHGEYRGQPIYYDAKAEYVQGLRNILNDIGANPLIRRVLFGKSDFDFDRHLERGGVLLVNTAKGELSGLSNILGKLILLSLQNAVFRRTPNISNFHHILVDEFPDYVYRPFKEFPAQSRKYKTIVTVVAQTVTQLADIYGETYMQTLLGTLRHKMVYGDIPDFDAELFSKIFGEKERFEEAVQEQSVSPLQDNPMLRKGNTYSKLKEAILSPTDIIYQKAFQCAIKIVANNKPIPVRQIDANFVPKEEFKEAVVTVVKESAEIWLENRKAINTITPPVEELQLVEEDEVLEENEPLQVYPVDERPIEYKEVLPIDKIRKEETRQRTIPVANNEQEELHSLSNDTSIQNITHSEESTAESVHSAVSETKVEERPQDSISKSKLGDDQISFLNEIQKDLDEISAPFIPQNEPKEQKNNLSGFYQDLE